MDDDIPKADNHDASITPLNDQLTINKFDGAKTANFKYSYQQT